MTSQHSENEVERLLDRLDGSGSDQEWSSAAELRSLLGNRLPDQLITRYRQARKWMVRSSYVYHAVRYAKVSEAAVELALLALKDKAKVVRYRSCMLLACSQRKELLPLLSDRLADVTDDTKADLLAAIDAIESQNQDYFVDRDHSGMITLNVR